MLTNPSPSSSISTSPSTASVPRRVFPFLSRSSSAWVGNGAGSSRTSNMRRRLERATTTLHKTRLAISCRMFELVGDDESCRVEGNSLRLVANSTPLAGRISWCNACMLGVCFTTAKCDCTARFYSKAVCRMPGWQADDQTGHSPFSLT